MVTTRTREEGVATLKLRSAFNRTYVGGLESLRSLILATLYGWGSGSFRGSLCKLPRVAARQRGRSSFNHRSSIQTKGSCEADDPYKKRS